MPYRLTTATGDQTYDLRVGALLVVGRALTSDIPVFDPTISRRHAEVLCGESGVEVRDLGSSNGTFVNGAKIESARLSPGDVVAFGKVPFRLTEVSPLPTLPPPPVVAPRLSGTIVLQMPVGQPPAAADQQKLAQKLSLLLEVSKGLTRTIDPAALLETIAGFCLQIFDVDYVSILLADERGEHVPKVSRDREGQAEQRSVPQSIVRTAVHDKVAILSDNAPEDLRFGGQSILMQRVRSTMCAPLVGGGNEGRVLGVLYVDNVTSTHRFDGEDLEFLIAFASIAAAAIENAQFALALRQQIVVRSNFERYFAPTLAARIAESPEAVRLGGDKRPVAVLFSDIRGFTKLSESMTPDDMASFLSEYFTEMVDCVFRHGGTLDKFMGDAVMAQWGAPLGSGDDADRAVHAAIDMMHALPALNVKWRGMGRPELSIGIGLNYGEAFAGNIGSERRLEFTVIGDTVNTASRICAAAEPGEILLSDDMRRALRAAPALEERPPLELKGKAQPVPVYRVRL
ncbi:MAG TPA: adenylate/guanylate cyclase domain-containing protein [Gemmatimonadaceae bacterium]|jgi:adenylate cyclase|nr:adenylate/guanylate cyclase domain-containing protein [Gemmatimonadaceae bacterium]